MRKHLSVGPSFRQKRKVWLMADGNNRTDDARRHDDSEMIDNLEATPSQGGRSGGTLQRDIATQAEEEQIVHGKTGVTRVRKEDEKS